MHEGVVLAGEVVNSKDPEWEPLLKLAPEVIDDFMWMFEAELEDGHRVQAYKHYWTRRYLHLDEIGRAFVYTEDDRYKQVGVAWLLDKVVLQRSLLRPHEEFEAERQAEREAERLYGVEAESLADAEEIP
jgi:hypothetical protein